MKNAILTCKSALYVSVALFAGLLMVFTPFAAKDVPTAVDAQGKLTTTWGDIKTDR